MILPDLLINPNCLFLAYYLSQTTSPFLLRNLNYPWLLLSFVLHFLSVKLLHFCCCLLLLNLKSSIHDSFLFFSNWCQLDTMARRNQCWQYSILRRIYLLFIELVLRTRSRKLDEMILRNSMFLHNIQYCFNPLLSVCVFTNIFLSSKDYDRITRKIAKYSFYRFYQIGQTDQRLNQRLGD